MFRPLAAMGLICAFVHASSHATSMHFEPCPPFVPRAVDAKGSLEPLETYIHRTLAENARSPRCIGAAASASGDLTVASLVDALSRGPTSQVRETAALALGDVAASHRDLAANALHVGLGEEKDARVFQARLIALARLVRPGHRLDLASLISSTGNTVRLDAVAQFDYKEAESASQACAQWLQALLIDSRTWARGEDDRIDKVMSMAAHVLARKATQRPYVDEWRLPLLESVNQALAGGKWEIDSASRRDLLEALMTLMAVGEPEIRIASFDLAHWLIESAATPERALWNDLRPEVTRRGMERLRAIGVATSMESMPGLRARGVRTVGLVSSDGTDVPLIVKALGDADGAVRSEAANALAKMRIVPGQAIPALHSMARGGGPDAEPAIRALSMLPSEDTLNLFVELVAGPDPAEASDEFESQRMRAARLGTLSRGLEKFGGRAVLSLLGKVHQIDRIQPQENVYSALVALDWTGLAAYRSAQMEQALAPAFAGSSESARQFALNLLARLRPYAGAHFSSGLVENLVARYLTSSTPRHPASAHSWRYSPAVAVALIAGNTESAVVARSLIELLCKGGHDFAMEEAIRGGLPGMEDMAVPALPEILRQQAMSTCTADMLAPHLTNATVFSSNPYDRVQAVAQLGQLGSKGAFAVPMLSSLAREDDSTMVREAATRALGLIGERSALDALSVLESDAAVLVARRAKWSAARIRSTPVR